MIGEREYFFFYFFDSSISPLFSTTLTTLFTAGFVHGPGCTQFVLLLTRLVRISSGQ